MEELWKDIEGYEGIYKISSEGKIKSCKRKGSKGRVLKNQFNSDGYLIVRLYKNSVGKTKTVHILVAKAFIPNPNNLPELNHKDENRANPKADNLEWCTRSYNVNYGDRNLKMITKSVKKVYQYSLDGELIKEWFSTQEAKRKENYQPKCIWSCCNGKQKTYKGCIWSYEPLTLLNNQITF